MIRVKKVRLHRKVSGQAPTVLIVWNWDVKTDFSGRRGNPRHNRPCFVGSPTIRYFYFALQGKAELLDGQKASSLKFERCFNDSAVGFETGEFKAIVVVRRIKRVLGGDNKSDREQKDRSPREEEQSRSHTARLMTEKEQEVEIIPRSACVRRRCFCGLKPWNGACEF
jgi:hypothetical protein